LPPAPSNGNAVGKSADVAPGRRSLVGLNRLNFLVAAMQMGFGPFLSVYLTGQLWNPEEIGFAFSIGTRSRSQPTSRLAHW
jgi:hypothetical protein